MEFAPGKSQGLPPVVRCAGSEKRETPGRPQAAVKRADYTT